MSAETEVKKTKFRSLAVSLTIVFFVLSAAILIVVGALALYFNLITQQKLIAEQQHYIAHDAANTAKSFIQEKFSLLEGLVSFSHLAESELKEEGQRQSLAKLLGIEPAFRQLSLLNMQEQEFLNVSRLSKYMSGGLKERAGSDMFSQVSQEKTYISLVYIDEITNEPLVIMAVPVKNVFGDFKGVLMAEVNLKFMWDLVGRMRIGEKGLAYVVDKQGNLIAFGDISRVLREENLSRLDKVSEFMQGKEALKETDISKGIQDTYVITTYVSLGTPDWAVVVELPVAEAYQSIIQLFGLSVLIVLLSFAIALSAGIFLSKRITKPIIKLRDVAVEISKGKLDTKIEIQTKDEIGQLADSFNSMTAQLTASIRGLREEEARLMASINSLPLGFAIVDVRGAFVIANPTLANLFSLDGKKFSLRDISARLVGKIGEENFDLDTERERAARDKKPVEFRGIFLEGKFICIFISPIILVRDGRDEVIGTVFLVEDITEQKRLEEAKSSFVAITAHELRTPLTIIRGNAELLLELLLKKCPDVQIKTMIDAIQRSSVRLLGIVDDFLDLTALEEHKMRFKNKQFNLINLVDEIVADFQGKAAEKSLSLKVSPPRKPIPEILADRERTKEIIINILGNAIQYTEKGGVALSFEKGDEFVDLLVKDTGIGIKPDEQKLLFQKFQTVSGPFIHSKEYGSGMGLYISKLLAESMGGAVRLKESSLGIGSTFVITFPESNNKRSIVE